MSTMFGLGLTSSQSTDLISSIHELANKYDYGLLSGIDNVIPEVRGGLATAQRIEGWEHLLLLQSPKGDTYNYAYGIREELSKFEIEGHRPKFFDFLIELSVLCSGRCEKLGLFFAALWYKDFKVRYSYGSVDVLISLLSMPGYHAIRFLIPETGRLQDCDEIPFIFDLKLE